MHLNVRSDIIFYQNSFFQQCGPNREYPTENGTTFMPNNKKKMKTFFFLEKFTNEINIPEYNKVFFNQSFGIANFKIAISLKNFYFKLLNI